MFRYPGGKGKLAKTIVTMISSYLRDHPNYEYREPFFGAGAIGLKLLKRSLPKKMWINDADLGISFLWTAVIQGPKPLCEYVDSFEPSIEKFYEFKEYLLNFDRESSHSPIEVGFKKLAIHQISYSGLGTMSGGPLGGKKQKSNYKIDCRWNPSYIKRSIWRLHNLFWSKRIVHKYCTGFDFATLINDDVESFFYLDPPYYEKGPELYQCSFSHNDHERLCSLLKRSSQPWILSYDDVKEIRDMYSFAHVIPVSLNYTITTSRSKKELLVTPMSYKYLFNNDFLDIFKELNNA